MSQQLSIVTGVTTGTSHDRRPSRVPPAGDAPARPPEDYGWQALPLSRPEMVAIAHLRGVPHFGPTCPICMGVRS